MSYNVGKHSDLFLTVVLILIPLNCTKMNYKNIQEKHVSILIRWCSQIK